jgi:predicted dehydrogenase
LSGVRRFSFENDAADEDLPAGHWFWDDTISGGVLLEHGVHFFDAAAMLLAAPPCRVQAIGGRRPDGRTDTVVCTVEHVDGALASHAHGFSHSRRAERQLMRLDFGLAEARVHGWIPLRADLDVWADDDVADSYAQLPGRAAEMLAVAGARPSGYERISVTVERDAAPAVTHARGIAYRAPHRVTACLQVNGPDAKDRVYRESVRAALRDLATSARTGSTPRANITAGHAAVRLAAAAAAALHDGTTHRLAPSEAS